MRQLLRSQMPVLGLKLWQRSLRVLTPVRRTLPEGLWEGLKIPHHLHSVIETASCSFRVNWTLSLSPVERLFADQQLAARWSRR